MKQASKQGNTEVVRELACVVTLLVRCPLLVSQVTGGGMQLGPS